MTWEAQEGSDESVVAHMHGVDEGEAGGDNHSCGLPLLCERV